LGEPPSRRLFLSCAHLTVKEWVPPPPIATPAYSSDARGVEGITVQKNEKTVVVTHVTTAV